MKWIVRVGATVAIGWAGYKFTLIPRGGYDFWSYVAQVFAYLMMFLWLGSILFIAWNWSPPSRKAPSESPAAREGLES